MTDKKKRIIVIAIFALAALLFIFKAFFGFDWSDESHYLTTANRILQGDRLFQEVQGTGMFPALIVLPLVALYKLIAGGTDGILLFMRFCYIALTCVSSVLFYSTIKKHTSFVLGIAASLVFFSVNSVLAISYNTMMVHFTVMALSFILPREKKSQMLYVRYALSGLFTALAVQAYPPAAIVIPALILFILLEKSQRFESGKQKLFAFLCYAAGGFSVALYFILFVALNSSLSAMIHNFGWVFVDEEHSVGGFSLFAYIKSVLGIIGGSLLIAYVIILSAAVILSFMKNKEHLEKYRKLLIWLAIIISALLVITKLSLFRKSMFQYIVYLAVALIFPVLFFANNRKWHFSVWMFLIGITLTLSVGYASNNGATFCIYPMIFAAAGTIIYTGHMLCEDKTEKKANRICIQCALSALTVCMILACFTYIYRDSFYTKLNTRLTSGPAKGICTTAESARKYEETIAAIDTYMPKSGNVLYVKLLPFGYLHSAARPASSRLWRTNLNSMLFEDYYKLNPDKLPDAIYIVNENYGVTNDGIEIGEFMQNYIDTHEHETIELDCATILIFNK